MTSTLMRVRKIREKGEGNNGRERDGYFGNSRLVVRYVSKKNYLKLCVCSYM